MPFDRAVLEFAVRLQPLKLEASRVALAILWFCDQDRPDIEISSGELSKIIFESGLGKPHSTDLRKAMSRTGLVIMRDKYVRLKHASRAEIRSWLLPVLEPDPPAVDHAAGFVTEAVWRRTRGYIERVAEQLNACVEFGLYDAASVMLRRLIETLIIEAYEHLQRQEEIKRNGNYLMLADLIEAANGVAGLHLGREAKQCLVEVKKIGDRSAHNRRYIAGESDLTSLRSGVRVALQELIQIGELQRPRD